MDCCDLKLGKKTSCVRYSDKKLFIDIKENILENNVLKNLNQ